MSYVSADYFLQAKQLLREVLRQLDANQNEHDQKLRLTTEVVLKYMDQENSLSELIKAQELTNPSRLFNWISGTNHGQDLRNDADILLQAVKSDITRVVLRAKLAEGVNNSLQVAGTGQSPATKTTNTTALETDISRSNSSTHDAALTGGRTSHDTSTGSRRTSPLPSRPLTPESMRLRTPSMSADIVNDASHAEGKSSWTDNVPMSREHSSDQGGKSAGYHKSSRRPSPPTPRTRSTKPKIPKADALDDQTMDAPEQRQSPRKAPPPLPQIATERSSSEYLSPQSAASRMSREPSSDRRASTSSRHSQRSRRSAEFLPVGGADNMRAPSSRRSTDALHGPASHYLNVSGLHAPNSIGATIMNGGKNNSGSAITFMGYPPDSLGPTMPSELPVPQA